MIQLQQQLLSGTFQHPKLVNLSFMGTRAAQMMRPHSMLFVHLLFALKTSAKLIPSNFTTTTLGEPFARNKDLADLIQNILQDDTSRSDSPKEHNVSPKSLAIVLQNSSSVSLKLDREDGKIHTPTRTAKQFESHRRQSLELRDLSEPTAPPSSALRDNSMCVFLGAALGICNSLTSGFTTLGPSTQAQCLCYSSAAWSPNIFDYAVGGCAAFASTAAPLAYAPLANLEGFCSSIGDVKAPKSTMVTTTVSATTTNTNSDCDMVTRALASCAGKDKAFNGLDTTEKAKCLCYDSNTSWRPTQFDNAVKTCAEDAFFMTSLPSVQPLAGLCEGIGNVLERSTLMPSATTLSEDASSNLPPSSLEALTSLSTSMFPVSTFSDATALSSSSLSSLPTSVFESSESISSIQSTSIPSIPGQTSSEINILSSTEASTSLTSTPRYTPNTVVSTRTSNPSPTGMAIRRKVEKWEIILVSFCCAMVLLFLC